MSKKRMDYTWNRSRQKKYDTCGRHLYMDGKKNFKEKKKNNKPSLSGVAGALSRGKFF